jgi:hypothetical protein
MSNHKNKKMYLNKITTVCLIILILTASFFIFKNKDTALLDDITSLRCVQTGAQYLNTDLSTDERVKDLMTRMTDWEKFGQMVLVEKNSVKKISDITTYNLGALLSGGGAGPHEDTPLDWLEMVNDFQSATKDTCLKIHVFK